MQEARIILDFTVSMWKLGCQLQIVGSKWWLWPLLCLCKNEIQYWSFVLDIFVITIVRLTLLKYYHNQIMTWVMIFLLWRVRYFRASIVERPKTLRDMFVKKNVITSDRFSIPRDKTLESFDSMPWEIMWYKCLCDTNVYFYLNSCSNKMSRTCFIVTDKLSSKSYDAF